MTLRPLACVIALSLIAGLAAPTADAAKKKRRAAKTEGAARSRDR